MNATLRVNVEYNDEEDSSYVNVVARIGGRIVGRLGVDCYPGMVRYGEPDAHHCRITSSWVKPGFRRKGIGTQLYMRAAKEAKRLKAPLFSDKHVSPEAQKLWQAFIARGWARPTPDGHRYWFEWIA